MGLDFTVLNNISIQLKAPATDPYRSQSGEAESGAIHRLESEKKERERARQMYATYQQNIKRAGMLKNDIANGLKAGEDPLAILLKAIECISLMTGDTVIYTQGKEYLLDIYGWGLSQPAPLKVELEEAQHRLAMLTRPGVKNCSPDAQKRIERAIQAHRDLIDNLEREIKKTGL